MTHADEAVAALVALLRAYPAVVRPSSAERAAAWREAERVVSLAVLK